MSLQEQTAMDHLLGALGQELEAYEAEEGSGSDNGQVSGTEQGVCCFKRLNSMHLNRDASTMLSMS